MMRTMEPAMLTVSTLSRNSIVHDAEETTNRIIITTSELIFPDLAALFLLPMLSSAGESDYSGSLGTQHK